MNGEGIPQAVGAYTTCSARLGVHQVAQACLIGAVAHNPPGMVTVDAEDEHLAASQHGPTSLDEVFEHLQGIIIDWEGPHPAVLLRLGHGLSNPAATFGAEEMGLAQPGLALGAGKFQPELEVLNCHCALAEVDVLNCDSEGFRYAAAQAEEEPDQ